MSKVDVDHLSLALQVKGGLPLVVGFMGISVVLPEPHLSQLGEDLGRLRQTLYSIYIGVGYLAWGGVSLYYIEYLGECYMMTCFTNTIDIQNLYKNDDKFV